MTFMTDLAGWRRGARLLALLGGMMVAPLAAAADVTVFAAASLQGALDQVAADFTAAGGGRVVISYAGSGALARQIIDGAPADLFISAASDWMDQVAAVNRIAATSRRDLLGNRLVLVAHDPAAAPLALEPGADLAGRLAGGRLAMALVDAVPAGQYGKAALESLGLWGSVADQVAQADNVRAALALVSTGEAPFGIVYATDAAAGGMTVAGTFPADSHPPVVYPVALIRDDAGARAFYDALLAGGAVFAAHGFTFLPGADD